MPVHNPQILSYFGGFGLPRGLETSGPASATNAQPALTNNAKWSSDCMAHEALNAPFDSAQYTDPLIVNARLVNLAAEIERNLAARKALRPARSAAAFRGWETRRDR